ncbi:stage V sporulation protein AE [Evansella clarkii]|jgi:stage V sporulation protein AE|uniref:stage V sporulation protein AE n=1 Tax=Evansella clarkii TaxID=79879 RepID=UPI00099887DD|nr:stage V sporulation protein AE [Evansella clarkii]
MDRRKRVIIITDGDATARDAAAKAAENLNCSFVKESSGNPSTHTAEELLKLILKAEKEPVLVLCDDCGWIDEGKGERVLMSLGKSPQIKILGAVAVASHSDSSEWTKVSVSIDKYGNLTEYGVDKEGIRDIEPGRIRGDTVSVLDQLKLPCIVGIGDPGKMGGYDSVERGAPVTTMAVELIIERSGFDGSGSEG